MSGGLQALHALEAYGLLCQLPSVREGVEEVHFQPADGQLTVRVQPAPFWWKWLAGVLWSPPDTIPEIYRITQNALRGEVLGLGRGSWGNIQVALDAINAQVLPSHRDLLKLPVSVPVEAPQLPVRGLYNPGNKCYANATLVGLCASSRFQEILLSQKPMSETAIYLRLLFQTLQTPGGAIPHTLQSMSDFVRSMAPGFPSLPAGLFPGGYSQQDAAEFMAAVLARTIGEGNISFKEIVERRAAPHTHLTKSICLSSLVIPAIDACGPAKAQTQTTNIFTVTFEEVGG